MSTSRRCFSKWKLPGAIELESSGFWAVGSGGLRRPGCPPHFFCIQMKEIVKFRSRREVRLMN